MTTEEKYQLAVNALHMMKEQRDAALDRIARIEQSIIAMRADYPEDVFPGIPGAAYRHAADRILAIVQEEATQ